MAVLLNKEPSRLECYNDLDSALVSFFRVVKYHLSELFAELDLALSSREEFAYYGANPGVTDIQRAARWYLRNKNSFGGKGSQFGTGKVAGGAALASRQNRIDNLRWVNQRLDKVVIENLPWQRLLQTYDGRETLLFLDPPYVSGGQDFYSTTWSEAQHRELAEGLRAAKSQWVLTYCDSPLIRELYADCSMREVSTPMGIRGEVAKKLPQLLIWRTR